MKIGKYRNSNWVRKDDVNAMPEKQRITTVERINEEDVGEDRKLVIYFRGIEKGWPANMTALNWLAEACGSDDTDDFAGTPVEIYVDPDVTYAGKRIGGIKLRRPPNAPSAEALQPQPKPKAPESVAEADFDDDLGF
jgi:hypothetical protein